MVSEDEVPHIPGLDLTEWFRPLVRLSTTVERGPSLGPVIVPVTVGVSTLTRVTFILSCCLPPHSVIILRLLVSIRIVGGQEVPVQFVKKIRMIHVVLHQLIQHPPLQTFITIICLPSKDSPIFSVSQNS